MTIENGTSVTTMRFYYDASGAPVAFTHNGTMYLYVTNLQGDIVGISDLSNGVGANYEYDAWGKLIYTSCAAFDFYTVMNDNPLRYRGYVYDDETGFYYLQSRYYDPVVGRFINADGQLNGGLLGYNLFAYCENNPVMGIDPTGNSPDWDKFAMGLMLAGVGALAVTAVVLSGGTCVPLVALGYAVLATAGTVAVGIGTSEVVESFTEVNPLKERIGEGTYNVLKAGSILVISMGSAIIEYGTSVGVCFVAGTPVQTEKGSLPIEEIEVGMQVYAHDPETGETALKEVVNTFIRESSELVHITVNGEKITTTPTHPFWVPQKGWTRATDLRAGDMLQLLNGEYVIIGRVQHELLEMPVTVYNFEVEDFHTYYVGDTEVLVHNQCGYEAPIGGGGSTDRITLGGKIIEFGHGGRHLAGTGLSVNQVNQAIANDVITRPPTSGVVGHGTVVVNEINIYYDYYSRSDELINVGTYYLG